MLHNSSNHKTLEPLQPLHKIMVKTGKPSVLPWLIQNDRGKRSTCSMVCNSLVTNEIIFSDAIPKLGGFLGFNPNISTNIIPPTFVIDNVMYLVLK